MTKYEIKQIVERRFQEWGSEQIELPSGTCWTLNGEYFKVTTISAFWVLEWTDNLNYAKSGCFEDVDPMPYNISEKIILNEVDKLLSETPQK